MGRERGYGRSVWGAEETSIPLESQIWEMKFKGCQADIPCWLITFKWPQTKVVLRRFWRPVGDDGDSEAICEKRKMNISFTKLPRGLFTQSRNADFENIPKWSPFPFNKQARAMHTLKRCNKSQFGIFQRTFHLYGAGVIISTITFFLLD